VTKFNIACINQSTFAEGPGNRLAIWFQGCVLLCEGCCNPEMQELKPVHLLTLNEIVAIVAEAKEKYGIEGVTFLGGEPTLQQGLAELSVAIQNTDLGVILFTGELVENLPSTLLKSIDLIVDGRFIIDQPDLERNLIGSKNQRLVYCSERYKQNRDWFFLQRFKRIEVNVSRNLFITGDAVM
jgi:anaerobic ribonucleoside-triphosphate reductase activating protein